jgi:hypothetical protein
MCTGGNSEPPEGLPQDWFDGMRRELKTLWRGEGLTAAKLPSCPGLLSLCCLGHGRPREGLDEGVHAAQRFLESYLRSRDDFRRTVLRWCFAVDVDPPEKLGARLVRVAAELGLHSETVEKYRREELTNLIHWIACAETESLSGGIGFNCGGRNGRTW